MNRSQEPGEARVGVTAMGETAYGRMGAAAIFGAKRLYPVGIE
jgi:hypothetical protein